ncbi:MAG: glycosyltransferase [Candidatus Saccharibacteria bacterium]|nr:glycosyltransferase [Candidatus Saccharibacteria bacterium]
MKTLADVIIPNGSLRRKIVKKILRKLHLISGVPITYYNTWVHQKNEFPPLNVQNLGTRGPLISVVVPVYNTPEPFLDELVYSVISQAYEEWELLLVDASTSAETKTRTRTYEDVDKRIHVIPVKNSGIAGNTNVGIENARGEYIAFSDHDDILDPYALYEVALKIVDDSADIVYTDEDKVSENSEVYFDPHYKPDWSPDLLTHVNYMNHLTVVRKSLLDKVGLLDTTKDGAQDYDLMLRLTDTAPIICHVPKVLYHWRAARASTASNFSSKKNITDAGKRALEEHFSRLGTKAKVMPKPDRPGFYELKLEAFKSVSLIITPFASDALLRLYTELLLHSLKTSNIRLELIVPEGVVPEARPIGYTVIKLPATKTFLHDAIKAAGNEQLLIINSPVLSLTEGWLDRLTSLLRLDHIAAAAPLIVHHGSLIEDCGLVGGSDGSLRPIFKGYPYKNNQTYFGNTDWVRNVDALSGNFVVTRKGDLKAYLQHAEIEADNARLLKNYSRKVVANSEQALFNVVFSDVLFDNCSIRLQPTSQYVGYFNPNLIDVGTGSGLELYTPEAAALSILTRIKEDIMYGDVHEDTVETK